MKFERIHIAQYGRLQEVLTPEDGLPSLVTILGPNEGGKSTFFSFLSTLLYGFSPATRDAHPYTPWSGATAEGLARIRLDDGSTLEVHRRLRSNAWGRVTMGGRVEDIRNQPLPVLAHVPRPVFHQVFALTLAELAGLEGESWELIQDRLVGAMGAVDLKPSRSVAAGFDRAAGAIWRPSRRGNQEARALATELAELKDRRRAATDHDRELRRKVRDLESAEAKLRELREQRERSRVVEYRLTRLLPVRRKLLRIEELTAEAGDPTDLEGLPTDPKGRLDELRNRYQAAEGRIRRLDHETEVPRQSVAAYTSQHRAVVEKEDRFRRVLDRITALEGLREVVRTLEADIRDLQRRCQAAGLELLPHFTPGLDGPALIDVPAGELRDRVRKYQTIRDRRRIAEESLRQERADAVTTPGQILLFGSLGAAVLTAVLFAIGSFASVKTWWWAGSLAALIATVILGLQWLNARSHANRFAAEKAEVDRLSAKRVWELKSDEVDARARVAELVSELDIHEALLEVPSLDLASGIERLQDFLADGADRQQLLADRKHQLETAERDVQQLAESLSIPLPRELGADAATLDRVLKEAIEVRDSARLAERELERIRAEKREAEGELNEIAALAQSLARRLVNIGRGDLNAGLEEASHRLDVRSRATQLEEELLREHPDLDDLRQEIAEADRAGEEWSLDTDAMASAAAHREELNDQVENLRATAEALRTEIQHLEQGETVDQVDGQIESVRERLESRIRTRDRAFLLSYVVKEADHRFREEHQPDILRRAGAHLELITGGGYDRILMGDGDDAGFFLKGKDYPHPVRVGAPISTGTREQVYLAIRLAIVDHLDASGERLPLFMDEAFVNWDATRRDRAFTLLERISKDRQIFFFTCHEDMAAELEERGGEIIRLTELRAPTATPSG